MARLCGILTITPTLPVVDSFALYQQPASPTDTDTVSLTQKIYCLALLSRPPNHILQHLLVQTQIGHQFLQPLVFILQLPQTPQFCHIQTDKFLLPVVKNDLRNPHLSADFPDAGADFGLFQRKRDPFFGITVFFMAMYLSVR